MAKKKQEMSQVYGQNTNEFIFGEHGGRGKNLSSFLKNLSLTGSRSPSQSSTSHRESIRQANSNIYGNLAYGYDSPDTGGSGPPSFSNPGASDATGGPRRSMSSGSVPAARSPSHTKAAPFLESTKSRGMPRDPPSPVAGFRPVSRAASASGDSFRSVFRRPKYADLDDDWDADFTDMSEGANAAKAQSTENLHNTGNSVQDQAILDSFHPDLMISSPEIGGTGFFQPEPKAPARQASVRKDPVQARLAARVAKFNKLLVEDEAAVNIQELRKLSWNGVPSQLRAVTWQLLLGYLPTNKTRQQSILKRKRQEYTEGISKYNVQFEEGSKGASNEKTSSTSSGPGSSAAPAVADSSNKDNSANKEKQLFHQINIDVKRTNQTLKLYGYADTQKSLKKILFLWAIRHPASGYVQGINDICTPFYQLFLGNYLWQLQRKHAHEFESAADDSSLFIPGLLDEAGTDSHEAEIYGDPELHNLTWENFDPGRLSPRVTSIIEADSYWCISRLLDSITDNYIHEQPGIIKQVNDLHALISKIDLPLVQHLEQEGVEFIQFSFRWMNCLLMREVSIELVTRMWDTYLSETPLGFNGFHIYVCAAFLIKFSGELKEKDFQDILLFLQNPPTAEWTEKDIELMLSEAFIWQSLYKNAGARLR